MLKELALAKANFQRVAKQEKEGAAARDEENPASPASRTFDLALRAPERQLIVEYEK